MVTDRAQKTYTYTYASIYSSTEPSSTCSCEHPISDASNHDALSDFFGVCELTDMKRQKCQHQALHPLTPILTSLFSVTTQCKVQSHYSAQIILEGAKCRQLLQHKPLVLDIPPPSFSL